MSYWDIKPQLINLSIPGKCDLNFENAIIKYIFMVDNNIFITENALRCVPEDIINSLTPRKCGSNFKSIIFKLIVQNRS